MTYNTNLSQFIAILYDWDTQSFSLAPIDKATGSFGAATKIEGLTSEYRSGFGYDGSSDNYIFNSCYDDVSKLVAIDATTHALTDICEIEGVPQIGALYVDEIKPKDPLAPQAPDFVRATFPDGQLSGTITFSMPVLNGNEEDLSGQLSFVIKADDVEIASGTAAPGTEVSTTYTAPAAGMVTFTCTAAQDNHVSKEATIKIYVGNDTPSAPKNVRLTPVTVTWDPVTTGAHGGYVDASRISYTVWINGKIVAEGIKSTSCATNLPVNVEIQNYVAQVKASCNGLTGAPGSSNDILFGQPYDEPASFRPTDAQAELFTIINNNGDNRTWAYDSSLNAFVVRYNSRYATDDYLILPPVMIKDLNKLHHFTFDAWRGSSRYAEKLEVYIGKEPTPEGLSTRLIGTTTVMGVYGAPHNLECYFQVPEAGRWYIAVRGVSDRDKLALYVNNFNLEVSDVQAKGPAAVQNATAVRGPEGALKATVSFDMPTLSNIGEELKGDLTVTVESDVDFQTVSGTPGSSHTVEVLTVQGDNHITIQPIQGGIPGFPVTLNVYTGVEIPAEVTNFVMTPNENNHGIYARFDAPEAGIDGGYINKEDLTYILYQNQPTLSPFGQLDNWVKIGDLGKKREITTTNLLPLGTPLESYELGIAAKNVAGIGTLRYTTLILGQPYDMPAIEDFASGITKEPLRINTGGGMRASYMEAGDINEIDPKYAVKGKAVVGQGGNGQHGYFYIPSISTKGASKAALELSYYLGSCMNVTVYAEAFGAPRQEIFNESYLMGYPEGFQTLPVELPAQFRDKDWVDITIRVDFSDEKDIFVWNGYRMINMVQKDMTALKVVAPRNVAAGSDYDVAVDVANYGMADARQYSVELYADGEKIAEKAGSELAAYSDFRIVFPQTMSPLATQPIEYYARVIQPGDANTANNETPTATVTPGKSRLPGATELTAADSDNAVALTWNEPDLTAVTPDPVTDDFEDADAFAAEYGDWVFVDVDESPVGGFQNIEIPGITTGQTTGSFWIWDQDGFDGNSTFDAHSGKKYLFSLFRYDDGQANDWAISPQLYGGEQTVSFWVRSYNTNYPEKIAVYYSTGSTDPKDFLPIVGSQIAKVPGKWTQVTADLPEGAKRFAIRSFATGGFLLMVDDVTYTPAVEFTGELSLKGYDVYRDGVKLNDAPVENTAYADGNVVKGTEYNYVVVAVFDEGTGRVSNTASIVYGQSGLDELGAAKAIATARNTIIVRGFAGERVVVSSADGKVIANGEAVSDRETISVPAGVYVVNAGDQSVKVIVK